MRTFRRSIFISRKRNVSEQNRSCTPRSYLKKVRRHVRGTQTLRQNRAKELQNSRNFGAQRAHKKCVHSASVCCANHSTSMQLVIGRHACVGRPRRVMHNYSAVAPTREVEKDKEAFLRATRDIIQKVSLSLHYREHFLA